jgi:putative transposon-encoded protein
MTISENVETVITFGNSSKADVARKYIVKG